IRVGGPYYAQIVQSKDLIADILPPPAYIIESYLLVFQAANSTDPNEQKVLTQRLARTETEYWQRQQVWREQLGESRMKTTLVVGSAQPAKLFFQLIHERFLPALERGEVQTARDLANRELRDAYNEHRRAIDEVVQAATRYAADREREANSATESSSRLETAIGICGLLLGIAFGVLMIRALNRALSQVARDLNGRANRSADSATQVSSSSEAVARGASRQAASLQETSASLEQMSAMTKRNAENASTAKDFSSRTRSAVVTGVAEIGEMRQAMEAIRNSSDQVGKIIKTIDEIAFQTNILALNAAVEAARAGEAGAGFAIVAEEVRNLAQRSAVAARETSDNIAAAVENSERGVRVSAKVGLSLEYILQHMSTVDTLIGQIAQASVEQSQGIGQLNVAMSDIDAVTQSNAGSAQEAASAASELTAHADAVKRNVSDLLGLIHGRAA
ncbi:MAG TPA: methyl-accepting chemotaxis protein, partial [Polyangiaceae bacterium]|nr:methyl-accepting chemotaxis protein [Polyangiaceae bacterium]